MSAERVLILIGFFFVNGMLIGSLFTGRDYIIEVILFSLLLNVLFIGLLFFSRKRSLQNS
ncbi:hypothetical protein [Halalkalibacter akibai]|uniref:hypothetical protein n=1 Tax=Halalkalibacter akibai TaxID=1411 RepID=UPI00054F2D64|nr:hypothetical protein [Halalkalibacter akibai]